MADITHENLLALVRSLPTDHAPWGLVTDDQRNASTFWVDCSCGCRFYAPLEGALASDWGVCCNPSSPRAGLVTFEHQAGHGCFDLEGGEDGEAFDPAPSGFKSWPDLWAMVKKAESKSV